MRTFRDPRQARLIDVFEGVISPTGWRLIADGWQGTFRQVVLQELPALRLGDDLHETRGRPSAELYSMCGLLLLRDFYNWTVPQTFEAVLFRSDVQYALNLEPGFEVCQRTLERYLARMQDDDGLAEELMQTVTDKLARLLELSVVQLRLDSTHVLSDMASFGRTRMMGVTTKRFLNLVRRHSPADYAALPDALRTRCGRATRGRSASCSETRRLPRRGSRTVSRPPRICGSSATCSPRTRAFRSGTRTGSW